MLPVTSKLFFLDEKDVKLLLDTFLNFVKFDTRSDDSPEKENVVPSTEEQRVFAEYLAKGMREIGLQEVEIDEKGYLTATLPSNIDKPTIVVGLLAHLDTYPGVPGANVRPQVIYDYDGQSDIVLPGDTSKVIKIADFPLLKELVGETIITSDGTTLLGADDKAGIAVILCAMNWFLKHPGIRHGKIRIGFFPDEEIGRQAQDLDLEKFGANVAYTFDGENPGNLTVETFYAKKAVLEFIGRDAHPGANGKDLVNAGRLACEFIASIPHNMLPETTCGRVGFIHLTNFDKSDPSHAKLACILRDFDKEKLENLAEWVKEKARHFEEKNPGLTVKVEIIDQYPNMWEYIKDHPYLVSLAEKAMRQAEIEPKRRAARGGTDGSSLSKRGLPCADIFAGMQNFHSYTEWVALSFMVKSVETAISLVCLAMEIEK